MIVASQMYPFKDKTILRVTRKVLGESKYITREYIFSKIWKGFDRHIAIETLLFANTHKNFDLIYSERK
jgi:hypothetical protein